jgi:hypothetical protein
MPFFSFISLFSSFFLLIIIFLFFPAFSSYLLRKTQELQLIFSRRLESSCTPCCMDLNGPTTSVGTRTDYSVGPWDYPTCATRHLLA